MLIVSPMPRYIMFNESHYRPADQVVLIGLLLSCYRSAGYHDRTDVTEDYFPEISQRTPRHQPGL